VRGLHLYVRPIDTGDQDALRTFLDGAAEPGTPLPACGLLGKLIGDIVAMVALEVTDDAVRVDRIVVAPGLRRKWIGRAMMREVEQLAAKFDRRRIVVEDALDAQEFFRRVGFTNEGERWVRVF
jgi:ribosomal protein S18 acetylase RimI-like enzyme